MFVPVVKKIIYANGVLLERALPAEGALTVQTGDEVEPFTKLGAVNTPNEHLLLSGVWGLVERVTEKRAVLLKTQVLDLPFVACTQQACSGELLVFPNPSELLEMQYLEKFAKNVHDKIIYIGDFINAPVFDRAVALGVAGLVGGGIDKQTFALAQKSSVFVGVFGGFGKIPTPGVVFEVLKEVPNRYVFVQGQRRLLRVPVPNGHRNAQPPTPQKLVKELAVGDLVQVFDLAHFGFTGKVESVQGDTICVILDKSKSLVCVKVPNIIGLSADTYDARKS
ncbi:MAG: hypothetical protein UX79_C0035G0003 [candidate division WWE3 bacterium GW2011_GWB1_47_11]|uniref:KOW domain-containing protein n=1 Tax=candidate division WWE3 bacterium GW2011_GWB1_47_11 TaxID=1619117 RepID=A0A0G1RFZ6_UNCKA|nr:MAG: hypothetical protein UX79_C0035G0003 [candidate division WWE3 bacterium GW2011_GWB1_47_11]